MPRRRSGKRAGDAGVTPNGGATVGKLMTVSELIKMLRAHPGDLRVVVNGYEYGYDDLSPRQISNVRITLNTGTQEWEGRHGEADDAPAHASEPAKIPGDNTACRGCAAGAVVAPESLPDRRAKRMLSDGVKQPRIRARSRASGVAPESLPDRRAKRMLSDGGEADRHNYVDASCPHLSVSVRK